MVSISDGIFPPNFLKNVLILPGSRYNIMKIKKLFLGIGKVKLEKMQIMFRVTGLSQAKAPRGFAFIFRTLGGVVRGML